MSTIVFPTGVTAVTPATGDGFMFSDVSDSNKLKRATLADLPVSTATTTAIAVSTAAATAALAAAISDTAYGSGWNAVTTIAPSKNAVYDIISTLPTSAFTTIAVSGQDNVVADSAADTLTLVAGSGITLATSAAGDSVTITNSGPGTGTVTSVSIVTANGVSGTVATDSTTPAITLVLGEITPTSVNSVVISGASTPTLAVTGTTAVSGTNTGDQTNISGNAATATLASATNALKSATTTINVSSATAPTSGQILTATSSTAATWQDPISAIPTAITVANETSDTTCYLLFVTAATGDLGPKTSSGGLTFNSSTGTLQADALINNSGTALQVGGTSNGKIRFKNGVNANDIILQAGVTGAAYTVTLPTAAPGSDTVLESNSSGDTLWRATTGSGSVVRAASPTLTGTVTVPTPSNSTDAATKGYVDSVAQGLSVKQSCLLATAAPLPANTYLSGVITITATGTLTVDGVVTALNDRILVKDEVAALGNGVYKVTTAGDTGVAAVLTRSTDMDVAAEFPGAFVFVTSGTVNTDAGFVCTNDTNPTVGTTAIAFTQFSGAGEIIAGNGISKSANTLSIDTAITADLSSAQTFTNKTLTSPKLNENVAVTTTATKLNYLTSATGTTGTTSTNIVFSTSPTLVTPILGVASATSLATSAASPLLLTNGQLVTIALTSQTTGGTTLTIPDFASVVDEFTFKTKAQTMSNKTFVTPILGTPASGTLTNCTGLPAAAIVAGTLAAGTYLLAENASIGLDPAGSADGKYSGITVTGTGGATIAFGDLVTLDKDDSRWELVDISVAAAATGDARGILGIAVTSSTDGGALTIALPGSIIRADANFPALTIGAPVYASTTGDIVVTQPTTTDHVIRVIGFALTADEIYFFPESGYTTHT